MAFFDFVVSQVDEKDFSKDEVSFKGDEDGYGFSAYLFQKKESKKLYVVFNGALNKDRQDAKVYHRWSWNSLFDGSVLYISDPTLFKYPETNLAWYIGDKNVQFQQILKDFILKVSKRMSLSPEQIILYGSSGGGFAALKLASIIGNGILAVAINPQVNVFNYIKNQVDDYLNICWEENDFNKLKNRTEFDVLSTICKSNCRVLFIQNSKDEFHFKNHFIPFLEKFGIANSENYKSLKQQSSRIRYMIYDHPSGHAAEPKDMLPEILESVNYMQQSVGWSKKNFFILGSCISRDVFLPSYREDIGSIGYYPRTSFARLALEPVESIPDLNELSSPFQRKIVKQDMKLDVLHALATTSFDYILIDLIDERYGLVKYGNTFITNSYEVNVSGILGNVSQLEKIEAGSDEFYSLWEKGFKVFVDYCEENNLLDKVIVNKVYWASMLDDASPIPNLDKEKIIINNSVLDKLYSIMQKYISESNFIVYPKSYFVAKKDHKWGVMPFHYVDSFYKHTYEELNNLK
ncbi:DUF6270 domain-containing protein [Acinetobacter sp. ANC 3926]|uniref:Uncharacterized protein n=1 Tax=Acinetobacter genomosp. 15BJ TaxID=106651 RepID=R9AMM1_9GAMM|nr:YqiA/YcfP family alpha/beta fold hydrolase [Acinetobacter genomosp. 15BJ]EOR03423.1 hypothetical protein F896_03535 [Acinetobacter genomosp. 15BJ]MCH7291971.1 DUF6270 domain-containing protein [Acinetobacter genomosp. 15BJ]